MVVICELQYIHISVAAVTIMLFLASVTVHLFARWNTVVYP